jgi:hypothetical protein
VGRRGAIPAWRNGTVLIDPAGEAARLKAAADAWDWSQIEEAAGSWVAEQVTGYAEEVHRLVGQATGGSPRMAAVIRSLLAIRMATVLAVHHRILYDSENRLWDLVAAAEGPLWTVIQDDALTLTGSDPAAANRAALDLYTAVARRTAPLLDRDQSEVVGRALAVAESMPRDLRADQRSVR